MMYYLIQVLEQIYFWLLLAILYIYIYIYIYVIVRLMSRSKIQTLCEDESDIKVKYEVKPSYA
jgi:hypothetical protein